MPVPFLPSCLSASVPSCLSSKNTSLPINREIPLLGHFREEEVHDDDHDEAGDETFGAGATHAAGAGAASKTFVACDHSDRATEEDAFDQTFHDLPRVD